MDRCFSCRVVKRLFRLNRILFFADGCKRNCERRVQAARFQRIHRPCRYFSKHSTRLVLGQCKILQFSFDCVLVPRTHVCYPARLPNPQQLEAKQMTFGVTRAIPSPHS